MFFRCGCYLSYCSFHFILFYGGIVIVYSVISKIGPRNGSMVLTSNALWRLFMPFNLYSFLDVVLSNEFVKQHNELVGPTLCKIHSFYKKIIIRGSHVVESMSSLIHIKTVRSLPSIFILYAFFVDALVCHTQSYLFKYHSPNKPIGVVTCSEVNFRPMLTSPPNVVIR